VVPGIKAGESRDTRAAIRCANLSAGLFIRASMMCMMIIAILVVGENEI
jgi:hypothetical protein